MGLRRFPSNLTQQKIDLFEYFLPYIDFKTELRYEISIEVNNNHLTVLNNNVVLTNV